MTRRNRLFRVFDDLTGRSHSRLVDPLVAQVDAAREGSRLVRRMVVGELSTSDARGRMSEVEHRGDAHRAALIDALAEMLTTPIDREDLFRLSRAIDDVLDNLRDFVRESDLYRLQDQSDFLPLVEAVVAGIEALRRAVASIAGDVSQISDGAFETRKSAHRVRRQYQHRLADLFDETLTVDVLKRRELLRRMDVVGIELGNAADMLADGALKRSH